MTFEPLRSAPAATPQLSEYFFDEREQRARLVLFARCFAIMGVIVGTMGINSGRKLRDAQGQKVGEELTGFANRIAEQLGNSAFHPGFHTHNTNSRGFIDRTLPQIPEPKLSICLVLDPERKPANTNFNPFLIKAADYPELKQLLSELAKDLGLVVRGDLDIYQQIIPDYQDGPQ